MSAASKSRSLSVVPLFLCIRESLKFVAYGFVSLVLVREFRLATVDLAEGQRPHLAYRRVFACPPASGCDTTQLGASWPSSGSPPPYLLNTSVMLPLSLLSLLSLSRRRDRSPVHVRGFYRDKPDSGLSAATVRKMHSVLRKALKQAVLDGLIPRNVCEAVKSPKVERKEITPLDREQAKACSKRPATPATGS